MPLNVFCSTFEEQKNFIDAQLENNLHDQIEQIYNYTIECVDKNGGIYAEAQEVIKTKDATKIDYSRRFLIILGGLYAIEKLRQVENPTHETIYKMGEVSAALFSSELFSKKFKYHLNPNHEVYKASLGQIEDLYEYSLLLECDYNFLESDDDFEWIAEKKKKIESKLYVKCKAALTCRYFRPMMMMGKNSIFQLETYLYALSKGCVLYGLSDVQNAAHGGLFKAPIELFIHDQSHYAGLLADRAKCTEESYKKSADCIVNIASIFYQFICIDKIFGNLPRDYNRALLAEFYLLHENIIEFIPSRYTNSLSYSILSLEMKMIQTLEAFLNISMMELDISSDKAQSSSDFDIKLASDFPSELVRVFPELEHEIYEREDRDRSLFYDGKRTLRHHLANIAWFVKFIGYRL
ncbi:MAG: hypothetical protein Q8K37_06690 [Alphaproteobacteria bacterium]|nr:hypothetical protein [Alphaproteobacteria bacterium]